MYRWSRPWGLTPPAVLLVFPLAWPGALSAADDAGRFAIKGFGLQTCAEYLTQRSAQSADYHRFGGWLDGYLTAANRYEPDTFDLASWQETPIMAAWLADYCEARPDEQFIRAVTALINRLGTERLETFSDRGDFGDKGGRISVYQETLNRAAAELIARGHLQPPGAQAPGEPTKRAIIAFQQASGLEPTGTLDQPTLALLMQPQAADAAAPAPR